MQIAVVGGGVCGLTCAIALMKAGADVQVYEAANKFGEIGAGIGIGPNASRLLRKLGLMDDILARGDKTHSEWFQWRSGLGGHEVLTEMSLRPGEEPFMVHRAAFLDALVKHVDHSRVHFRKRCTKVVESPTSRKITIHFADGSTALADVVLGADGIKSAVRGAVTGLDPVESITYSGTSCYRGLVPIERVKAAGIKTDFITRPICFVGPRQHLIIFGVNAGKLVNVVAFGRNPNALPDEWERGAPANPAVVTVTKEVPLREFAAWGPDVVKLLGCIDEWSQWKINVVSPPLPTWVKGRVALVGDAAHGMLPHLGAGAGQGLEDAYLLARLLTHPQTCLANIENVLRVYDEVRKPRVQRVWDDTYKMGNVVDGLGPSGLTPEGLTKDMGNPWLYVWGRGVDDDVLHAQFRLRDSGEYVSASL
ncbi:hypothetical protein NM688_g2076 [Phlebia brevispora]|uniref:Uncharacterized protein n=1 Tax=Phlebia brevispora TaxID=194682 RepID=A0ACC1T9I6_9APHY|nr:hypothetical protein NM688_g2076 [Phlebia brevispora]